MEADMLKVFVEEAAALTSITLFVGMVAVWAQVIPQLWSPKLDGGMAGPAATWSRSGESRDSGSGRGCSGWTACAAHPTIKGRVGSR